MNYSSKSIESCSLKTTKFNFSGQKDYYQGKVRDVYWVRDKLIAIASDRISAFDHILLRSIPYKGQVLNQLAVHFLEATRTVVPNWLEASPDPNVSLGKACKPIRVEMVIRGYLAGHAWRVYKDGHRSLCGVTLPKGLKESDRLPEPIITPATKAEEGHDEDISRDEILGEGLVPEAQYLLMEQYTRKLFELGSQMARERGLILVDTKYEFGMHQGEVILIDEIHTPDSSRYFYADGYEDRQKQGIKQKQLSKEFVREWLMEHGFQGKEEQQMPELPDAFVWQVSQRYIELFEMLTGQEFQKAETDQINDRIFQNVQNYLSSHGK